MSLDLGYSGIGFISILKVVKGHFIESIGQTTPLPRWFRAEGNVRFLTELCGQLAQESILAAATISLIFANVADVKSGAQVHPSTMSSTCLEPVRK